MSPNTNIIFAGLGAEPCGIDTAGTYVVEVKPVTPYNAAGSPLNTAQQDTDADRSDVLITITLNGSNVRTTGGTGSLPSANQPTFGTRINLNCAAGDLIRVTLASGNANDSRANALKTFISIFQGI